MSSKAIPENQKKLYNRNFSTTKKQYDLYSIFIELAINLTKDNGAHSFIVPDSLIGRSNFEGTRRLLLTKATIKKWLHLNDVFESADVASLIYLCQKAKTMDGYFAYQKAENTESWLTGNIDTITISSTEVLAAEYAKIIFADNEKLRVYNYLKGLSTFDKKFIMWRGEEIGRKSEVILHKSEAHSVPILSGEDVHRYEDPSPTKWIMQSNVQKDATYSKNKILIRQLGDCINGTIDNQGMVTTQSVYSLLPEGGSPEDLLFYLGILNSSLFGFIYRMISGDKQTFKRIILENIKSMPLPPNEPLHLKQQISVLVLRRIHAASKTEAEEIEQSINVLVFRLYEFTDEMIKIVQS